MNIFGLETTSGSLPSHKIILNFLVVFHNCTSVHSLGIHLVDHGYCNRSDFNDVYNVCIIENCSPGRLDVKENKYIHLLNSLRPHGLNTVNPLGLRLIN